MKSFQICSERHIGRHFEAVITSHTHAEKYMRQGLVSVPAPAPPEVFAEAVPNMCAAEKRASEVAARFVAVRGQRGILNAVQQVATMHNRLRVFYFFRS